MDADDAPGDAALDDSLFVEILPKTDAAKHSRAYTEAYVGTVDPKQCGALIQRLSVALPLTAPTPPPSRRSEDGSPAPDLSCLKRVKRTLLPNPEGNANESSSCGASANGDSNSQPAPSTKRRLSSDRNGQSGVVLQVLLGPVDQVETFVMESSSHSSEALTSQPIEDRIERTFNLRGLERVVVPARPADSEAEWKEFQKVWPSSFYPHRSTEFREQSLQLTRDELEQMKRGIHEALQDASELASSSSSSSSGNHCVRGGAVVVDPVTGRTVARSSAEYDLQNSSCCSDPATINPLQTSVVLAIQAVSRIERRNAERSASMDNPEFQAGQYLCTGYDVYTTAEPSPYEAMALVHARIRRLVFGCPTEHGGGGITEHRVHALPGTNHKYRAFVCREGSTLWKACRDANQHPGAKTAPT
jgi:tRNA(Arg) A34 adenosine deaminase TadA